MHHTLWAIVPVKSLPDSKRRLAHILSSAERADLIHGFLQRTLQVLNDVYEVDRILVVSSDDRVLTTAVAHGTDVLIEESAQGLNTAVHNALTIATQSYATSALILPADLPYITANDVRQLSQTAQDNPQTIIITPDTQQSGTNALLLPLPTKFNCRYGIDSYHQHQQQAQRQTLPIYTLTMPNLAFDLDTEADWQQYQLTMRNEQLAISN